MIKRKNLFIKGNVIVEAVTNKKNPNGGGLNNNAIDLFEELTLAFSNGVIESVDNTKVLKTGDIMTGSLNTPQLSVGSSSDIDTLVINKNIHGSNRINIINTNPDGYRTLRFTSIYGAVAAIYNDPLNRLIIQNAKAGGTIALQVTNDNNITKNAISINKDGITSLQEIALGTDTSTVTGISSQVIDDNKKLLTSKSVYDYINTNTFIKSLPIDDVNLKGGFQIVTSRYVIPTNKRKEGMIIYETDRSKYFKLTTLSTYTWTEIVFERELPTTVINYVDAGVSEYVRNIKAEQLTIEVSSNGVNLPVTWNDIDKKWTFPNTNQPTSIKSIYLPNTKVNNSGINYDNVSLPNGSKILILDYTPSGSHALTIKQNILNIVPTADVEIRLWDSFNTNQDVTNVGLIVDGNNILETLGGVSYLFDVTNNNNILWVTPKGSNSFVEYYLHFLLQDVHGFFNNVIQVASTNASGLVNTNTGYGEGLSFIDLGTSANAQSWAAGVVAGKLLKIKNSLTTPTSWEKIVLAANKTASFKNNYTIVNGFGVINTTAAINYLNNPIIQDTLNDKVSKAGDTMTGGLNINASNVQANFDNDNSRIYMNTVSTYLLINPNEITAEISNSIGTNNVLISPKNINLSGFIDSTHNYSFQLYHSDLIANDNKILNLKWTNDSAPNNFYVKNEGVYHNSTKLVKETEIANFETSTTLNVRDTANRNRNNHTGTQTFTTISNFESGVGVYEKAGYKAGGAAVTNLEINTEYYVDGSVSLLELPVNTGTGGRILLVNRLEGIGVTISVADYSNTLNGVVHGTYTFTEEFEMVLCMNSHTNGWTVKKINTVTTAELNTRDINNRNRGNHTGIQLYNTINNFETGVQLYEKAGYKKNAIATSTLAFDNLYIVEGTNNALTLPFAGGTGKRIMLISTASGVSAVTRLYAPTGNYINDVLNDSYTFVTTNDVVELIDVGISKWVLKSLGEKPTPIFTGWGQYTDTTHTISTPLIIPSGVRTKLLNTANTVINTQLPTGVTSFWNETTNKLIAVNANDLFIIDIRFKAVTSTNNDSFSIAIDIGGSLNEIVKDSRVFVKTSGIEQSFSIVLNYFTGSTFLANGGDIYINNNIGTLSIYDINFLITRIHKGI